MSVSILNLLAIGGILLSGTVFFLHAKRHPASKTTVDGYLLAKRQIDGKAFANTFFSFGVCMGNLIFFIELHKEYGYLIALFPSAYYVAKLTLLKLLQDVNLEREKYNTLAELWFSVFPCSKIARIIAIMGAVTSLMSLFAELCIGSAILSLFLPNSISYQVLAFYGIGLLVISYAFYGGYSAIVKTDTWQLWLMIAAFVALMYFTLVVPAVNSVNIYSDPIDTISKLFSFQEQGVSLYLFSMWAITINVCGPFVDPESWQRIGAVASFKDAIRGMYRGIWRHIITLWLPIFAFVLLYIKGYEYNTLKGFLDILSIDIGWLSYIIFPLVVTGFAAALFSTADSHLIAIMYSLSDSNTFGPKLASIPKEKRNTVFQKYLLFGSFITITAMSILYFFENSQFSQYIMPVLYAVWSQITVLVPLAAYAIFHIKKGLPPLKITSVHSNVLTMFLMTSWAIVLYGSWQSAATDNYDYSHVTLMISILLLSLGVFVTIKFDKIIDIFNIRMVTKQFN